MDHLNNLLKNITRHIILQKSDSRLKKTIYISSILLCIIIFLPFFPGVFAHGDEAGYWYQTTGINPIKNWHSPFFLFFWRFTGFFGGFFLFTLFSYWIGLGITFYALFDNLYARLLSLLFIGFFPFNIFYSVRMMVSKFMLLCYQTTFVFCNKERNIARQNVKLMS